MSMTDYDPRDEESPVLSGPAPLPEPDNPLVPVSLVATLTKAEIDQQIATAHQFPRSPATAPSHPTAQSSSPPTGSSCSGHSPLQPSSSEPTPMPRSTALTARRLTLNPHSSPDRPCRLWPHTTSWRGSSHPSIGSPPINALYRSVSRQTPLDR